MPMLTPNPTASDIKNVNGSCDDDDFGFVDVLIVSTSVDVNVAPASATLIKSSATPITAIVPVASVPASAILSILGSIVPDN